MAIGLVGSKRGMSRVFTNEGESIPVTVIEVSPNRVTQIKTVETDGYYAVQVTTGSCHVSRLSKAEAGHFKKAGIEAGRGLWEFRISPDEDGKWAVGDLLTLELLKVGDMVDITGTSIGKGYTGVIKRYGFTMGDATHGNSLSHRIPGSTGQNQTPGRVFKGKKMAGHSGNIKRTVQNLEIIKVEADRNLLLIRGAVPGAKSGDLIIHAAVKSKKKAS